MYINRIIFGAYSDAPIKWKIKHILHHYFNPFSVRCNLIELLVGTDLVVLANTKITGTYGQSAIFVKNKKKALIFNNHFECKANPPRAIIEA